MYFYQFTHEEKEAILDAIRIRLGVDHLAAKHGEAEPGMFERRQILEDIAKTLSRGERESSD